MKQIGLLLLGVAVMCGLGAGQKSADWPGWRGPNRDGKSADVGLLKQWPADGPRLLWKTEGVGKGFASVAVVGDTVYTAGDVDGKMKIFAIDKAGKISGSFVHDQGWAKNYPGARGTPVIDGDRLYIVSAQGLVGCYDLKTGRKRWTQSMGDMGGRVPGWGYAESLLIHGELAIVTPGGRTAVVALNKMTGQRVWASAGFSADAHYSSPIAITRDKQSLIVVGTGAGLGFLDARTGQKLWQSDFAAGNTANCPTPAYADGYVFWANGYGKGGVCIQVDLAGGKWSFTEAWKTRDMVSHHGGYIIDNGYIYGNHEGGWACLELKTGKRMWSGRAVGKGSICYADGMLYLFGESGGRVGLAEASPDSLKTVGEFRVAGEGESWAYPVVAGGKLYVRYDNNLYCYDVSDKAK